MKYLILKGCAGLGNRIFTICSAIEYCQKNDRVLVVDWTDGQFGKKGENVFNRYFQLEDIVTLPNISAIDNFSRLSQYPHAWKDTPNKSLYDLYVYSSSPFWSRLISRFSPKGHISRLVSCWRVKRSMQADGVFGKLKDIFSNNCIELGNNYSDDIDQDILFYADFLPLVDPSLFLKHLSLKDDIKQEIDRYAKSHQLSWGTVGVHVRATDKRMDRSLEQLFEKIEGLSKSSLSIFLATDNIDIETIFKKRYKSVTIYPKELPAPSEKRGIHMWGLDNNDEAYNQKMFKESIIDMWLLSKCEYLLYQGNSTFSMISKYLHTNQKKVDDWEREELC